MESIFHTGWTDVAGPCQFTFPISYRERETAHNTECLWESVKQRVLRQCGLITGRGRLFNKTTQRLRRHENRHLVGRAKFRHGHVQALNSFAVFSEVSFHSVARWWSVHNPCLAADHCNVAAVFVGIEV